MPQTEFGEEAKWQLLRDRWKGEEERIQKIIEFARKEKYEDWTVYLEGLPLVNEIKPVFDEKYGRDLRGIRLSKQNLSEADLRNADLISADLHEAELKGVNLSRAKLTNATLQAAVLNGAILYGADVKEAFLLDAKLENAILDEADISRACLIGANLNGAQFNKTTLINTDLSRAQLIGANLRGIDLQTAKFYDTSFREADLQDANLRKAKGLLAKQFAGANVCNAKLPADIQRFDALKYVEEASKHARATFLTVLLGCVYSWLTIATTTDPRLLTNSASSPLPIIGTEIPIVGFYIAAPLLLFGFYIYLHLGMQRLWEGLAKMPAVFPDGRPLDERIYPWLVTGLVRAHFPRLRNERPAFYALQKQISIVLAWWVVPVTLLLFWWRYLHRHDWLGTCLHILLLGMSVLYWLSFYRLAIRTLSGQELIFPVGKSKPVSNPGSAGVFGLKQRISSILKLFRYPFIEVQYVLRISGYALAGYVAMFLSAFLFLSFLAIFARSPVGKWACADFYEADISTKPQNWTGKEIELVKGAKLKGARLNYCLASKAFLIYADLRETDLSYADLSYADLRGANLTDADLRGAHFSDADLRGADLSDASLHSADLRGADLSNADLRGADLSDASLHSADLRGADLSNADLRGAGLICADLRGAHLSHANLRGASLHSADLSSADLSHANLNNANFNCANLRQAKLLNADLSCANLLGADLSDTTLRNADLCAAVLYHANLTNADLCGTDLTGWTDPKTNQVLRTNLRNVIGLIKEQIEPAIIDVNTRLPEDIEDLKEDLLKKQTERESSLDEGKECRRSAVAH